MEDASPNQNARGLATSPRVVHMHSFELALLCANHSLELEPVSPGLKVLFLEIYLLPELRKA